IDYADYEDKRHTGWWSTSRFGTFKLQNRCIVSFHCVSFHFVAQALPPLQCNETLRQAKLWKGGSDVGNTIETFRRDPVGNQSHPVEPSQQPEASLAWWRGDPSDEA